MGAIGILQHMEGMSKINNPALVSSVGFNDQLLICTLRTTNWLLLGYILKTDARTSTDSQYGAFICGASF